MFNDGPTEYQQREVLRNLRSQGYARIEASFSGGNDEGGIDSITFYDAEGNEMPKPPQPQVWRQYRGGTEEWCAGSWNESRPATAEELAQNLVWRVIEKPVYDRYYTFAGEFYVDGTLTWDVVAGTHNMEGQEQVSHWESFSY